MFYKNARIFCSDHTFRHGSFEVTDDGHALLVEGGAIFINDGDTELVVTAILVLEAEAQSQGASGVDNGELAGIESIEGALDAELTLIVGGVVAKNSSLDVHDMCIRLMMRFLCHRYASARGVRLMSYIRMGDVCMQRYDVRDLFEHSADISVSSCGDWYGRD